MKITYSEQAAATLAGLNDGYSRDRYDHYVRLLGYDPLLASLSEVDRYATTSYLGFLDSLLP